MGLFHRFFLHLSNAPRLPGVRGGVGVSSDKSTREKGATRLTPCVKHRPVKQGQTTTSRTTCPTLSGKCVGSLTSPAKAAHSLQGTSTSCTAAHSPQGTNPRPPAQQTGALPTELTRRRDDRHCECKMRILQQVINACSYRTYVLPIL